MVVDAATGVVVQELRYDAWGRVLVDTNPGWQPFGYAGGIYDPATGLVRFGARDYDAGVGRWTSKDPIGFAGGAANTFAYVGSNPTNAFDLTGTRVEVDAACLLSAASFAFSLGGDLFVALKLLRGIPAMANFLTKALSFESRGGLVMSGTEIVTVGDNVVLSTPGSRKALEAASSELGGFASDLVSDVTIPGAAEAGSHIFGEASSVTDGGGASSLLDIGLRLIPGVGSYLSFKDLMDACTIAEQCPLPSPEIRSRRR